VGGGDDAIEACFFCEQRQRDRSGTRRSRETDPVHGSRVQACQYCDAEQSGPALLSRKRLARSAHHGQTAGGVDGQKAYLGKLGGGSDGSGNRVRNVMEFQVEENFGASGCELLNCTWAFGGEELASNFEELGDTLKPPGQPHGWPQAVKIQRDD
jgi:hypothetical protein